MDAFGAEVREYHDAEGDCACVTWHVPAPQHLVRHHVVPLSWGGPDTEENTVWLCPTTHGNVHRLLWDYERFEGEPPWRGYRWHYSLYTRRLAERAWEAVTEADRSSRAGDWLE